MVISIAVVAVLGVFLMQQIISTTLEAKEQAAKSEAQSDRNAVLGYLSRPDADPANQPADSGEALQQGGGTPSARRSTRSRSEPDPDTR